MSNGEHPRFTMEDTLARDLASGKAAIEELDKLRQIIKYCADYHPTEHKVTITFSMADKVCANNFKELLEKYAEIVAYNE